MRRQFESGLPCSCGGGTARDHGLPAVSLRHSGLSGGCVVDETDPAFLAQPRALSCSAAACSLLQCAACGTTVAGSGAPSAFEAHVRACGMRRPYAVALAVEALRRVQLGLDEGAKLHPPPPAPPTGPDPPASSRPRRRQSTPPFAAGGNKFKLAAAAAAGTSSGMLQDDDYDNYAAMQVENDVVQAQLASSSWSCAACTYRNEGRETCGMCGSAVPSSGPGHSAAASAAGAPAVAAASTNPWSCDACTFVNESHLTICEMCAASRPPPPPPPPPPGAASGVPASPAAGGGPLTVSVPTASPSPPSPSASLRPAPLAPTSMTLAEAQAINLTECHELAILRAMGYGGASLGAISPKSAATLLHAVTKSHILGAVQPLLQQYSELVTARRTLAQQVLSGTVQPAPPVPAAAAQPAPLASAAAAQPAPLASAAAAQPTPLASAAAAQPAPLQQQPLQQQPLPPLLQALSAPPGGGGGGAPPPPCTSPICVDASAPMMVDGGGAEGPSGAAASSFSHTELDGPSGQPVPLHEPFTFLPQHVSPSQQTEFEPVFTEPHDFMYAAEPLPMAASSFGSGSNGGGDGDSNNAHADSGDEHDAPPNPYDIVWANQGLAPGDAVNQDNDDLVGDGGEGLGDDGEQLYQGPGPASKTSMVDAAKKMIKSGDFSALGGGKGGGTGYTGGAFDAVLSSVRASEAVKTAERRGRRVLQVLAVLRAVFRDATGGGGAAAGASSHESAAAAPVAAAAPSSPLSAGTFGQPPAGQDALLLQLLLGPGALDGLAVPTFQCYEAASTVAKMARSGKPRMSLITWDALATSGEAALPGVPGASKCTVALAPGPLAPDGRFTPTALPPDGTLALAVNQLGCPVLCRVQLSGSVRLGEGDGWRGPSALHSVCAAILRTSAAELQAAPEVTRHVMAELAALLQCWAAATTTPAGADLTPVLLYAPGLSSRSDALLLGGAGAASDSSAASGGDNDVSMSGAPPPPLHSASASAFAGGPPGALWSVPVAALLSSSASGARAISGVLAPPVSPSVSASPSPLRVTVTLPGSSFAALIMQLGESADQFAATARAVASTQPLRSPQSVALRGRGPRKWPPHFHAGTLQVPVGVAAQSSPAASPAAAAPPSSQPPSPPKQPCDVCSKPTSILCVACQSVYYCGASCAASAKPAHASACKVLALRPKKPAPAAAVPAPSTASSSPSSAAAACAASPPAATDAEEATLALGGPPLPRRPAGASAAAAAAAAAPPPPLDPETSALLRIMSALQRSGACVREAVTRWATTHASEAVGAAAAAGGVVAPMAVSETSCSSAPGATTDAPTASLSLSSAPAQVHHIVDIRVSASLGAADVPNASTASKQQRKIAASAQAAKGAASHVTDGAAAAAAAQATAGGGASAAAPPAGSGLGSGPVVLALPHAHAVAAAAQSFHDEMGLVGTPPSSMAQSMASLRRRGGLGPASSAKRKRPPMPDAQVQAVLAKVAGASRPLQDPSWVPSAMDAAVDAYAAHQQQQQQQQQQHAAGEQGDAAGPAGATAFSAKRRRFGNGAGAAAAAAADTHSEALPDDDVAMLAADATTAGGGSVGDGGAPPLVAPAVDLAPGAPYRAPEALQRRYVQAMRGEAYDELEDLQAEHAALADVGPAFRSVADGAVGRKRLLKVAADLSTLPQLAVHWASSILVRYDSAAMDVMRAYITGPEGTPYQGGFFGVDLVLPGTYPNKPPAAKFLTTGGGAVRFNP